MNFEKRQYAIISAEQGICVQGVSEGVSVYAAIKLAEIFRTPAVPEQDELTLYSMPGLQSRPCFLRGVIAHCGVDEQGHWVDDIIYHSIKCPRCGQVYTCVINTYNGRGQVQKGR